MVLPLLEFAFLERPPPGISRSPTSGKASLRTASGRSRKRISKWRS